jgi:hypothetical protein
MRKALFRFGWAVLLALPVIYGVQILVTQDLPPVSLWQWGFLAAVVVLVYFTRNTDEVLKHHVI